MHIIFVSSHKLCFNMYKLIHNEQMLDSPPYLPLLHHLQG
jgi:hypothetical protein